MYFNFCEIRSSICTKKRDFLCEGLIFTYCLKSDIMKSDDKSQVPQERYLFNFQTIKRRKEKGVKMKNAKKRIGFSKVIAVVLAILSIVMPTVGVYADELIEPSGQAAGIQSGASYMIKNAVSGKYLTLPGYFDVEYDGKNNVYQSSAKVNDQYSRAVTVTYGSGKYNLSPLLFQGIIIGGLKNDGSGNVVFGETANVEYNWAIEKVNATQYRIYSGGLALTSYGYSNGSVDSSGTSVAGNIYLTAVDVDSQFQLWTFEAVTVNPHMLKNTDITKKNLGTGAEWLFQLGSGEMAADSGININSVSFSNLDIVRAAIVGGKRVIVKLSDDTSTPDDGSDDYTVMTFNLNTGIKRIAVVQDAGTGGNDACLTLPFESEKKLRVVTLEEGANSEYILTFKSMPNIKITNWQILSDTGVEFAQSSGIELKGENFAVVKFNDVGFAVVRATDISGSVYTLMLDVEENAGDGYVYCAENSIILDADFNFEFGRNQYVMFRFSNRFYDLLNCEIYSGESVDIIDYNEECLVLKTKAVFYTTKVMLSMGEVNSNDVENIIDQVLITLNKDPLDRLGGAYYIQNIESGLFLELAGQNDSGVKTEVNEWDAQETSQVWEVVYLNNGYYWILSKRSKLALGVKTEDVSTKNKKVCQLEYDLNSLTEINVQWRIEYLEIVDGVQHYKITNRATLEAGASYVMCANGTAAGSDVIIDKYIGNDGVYSDEWTFELVYDMLPSASVDNRIVYEIIYTGDGTNEYLSVKENSSSLVEYHSDSKLEARSLWRISKNGDYYKIYSMLVESEEAGENLVLGYKDGSVQVMLDNIQNNSYSQWEIKELLVAENASRVIIYPRNEPLSTLTKINQTVAVSPDYDPNKSVFSISESSYYSEFGGGYTNLYPSDGKIKIYCEVDVDGFNSDDWDESIIPISNIEYAIEQWNSVSPYLQLILCDPTKTPNLPERRIIFKMRDDQISYGYTKIYDENGVYIEDVVAEYIEENDRESEEIAANILDALLNSDWKKTEIIISSNPLNSSYFESEENRRGTLIHEIGHALKLTHVEEYTDKNQEDASETFLSIMHQYPDCENYTPYITNFDRMALLKKWGLTEAEEEYA